MAIAPANRLSTAQSRPTRLSVLRLVTTRACPLTCGFCSVNAGPGRLEMMAPDAAERLLRDFATQGGSELTLTGGEPLIYPAIERLAAEARRWGLRVTLFTMGLVEGAGDLPAERIARLIPLTHQWRFSLHGATDRAHDRVTGVPGSLQASLSTVRRLVDANAWVGATFVARPGALDELGPVALMCGEMGVRELRVLGLVAQGRQTHSPGKLPTQVLAAVEEADKLSRATVRLGDATLAQLGLPNACHAFDNELVVGVDGWVSACHMVEPTPSNDDRDNVFRTGLAKTLRESPRLESLRVTSDARGRSCRNGCIMERSTQAPLVMNSGS